MPVPDARLLVVALADARRHIASYNARSEPIDDWLATQVKRRGVFENAAVLAAIEVPMYREMVAHLNRRAHPEHTPQLDGYLRQLES